MLFLLLCLALPAARADSLLELRHASQGSMVDAPDALWSAQGVPMAASGTRWSRWDAQRRDWQPVAPAWPGRVLGSVESSGEAWLFVEAAGDVGASELLPWGAPASGARPPRLPHALRQPRAAWLGDTLYVAGLGADGSALWMAWSPSRPGSTWQTLPAWPGSRSEPLAAAAQYGAFYLAVDIGKPGANATAAQTLLWGWTPQRGWFEQARVPGRVVPGGLRASGQAHLLWLSVGHAGAQLYSYHLITGGLAAQGAPQAEAAAGAMAWGNGFLWHAPAAGASALKLTELEAGKQLLRPLDWVMVALYLLAVMGIGAYCYWREEKKSTAEFFVGSRSIPFWAAAVSLYVTSTSSIGYIATTAKAFATNWQYLMNNLLNVVGLIFVAVWIVPMLRRLKLVSVFDYLEQRFHPSVRLMSSAFCIVLHLAGRMSIILFLPSLAIATVTGFSVTASILTMGLVTIAYTALGGMKAVIWTDILQFVVKLGGMIFVVVYIVTHLDGGSTELVSKAMAADKMKMVDWRFDLTQATVWGFVFLVLMEIVLTFPKDQVLMQRVFTTSSDKEAGRAVWLFAALVFPAAALFYVIGTGLWVYYQAHPERLNPLLPVDATFPLFIAAELPAGVTGLIIAGVFAASMATCASIMNSVATMVSVDFYERLAKRPSQQASIRLAEWVTVIAGLVGIGLALLLSRYRINSYLDTALELYGLLSGGFGGAYTLGMFTRRANWQGVLIGIVISTVLTLAAWWVNLVHPFLYLAISILFSIVFGYLASLFFAAPDEERLRGLVIQGR